MNRRPRVGISYRERGDNPLKHRTFERMRSWADVELLDPTREHPDIAGRGYDLYHMAKRRRESLADLGRASETTPTVNPYEGAWLSSDRVARHALLSKAGVPVPEAAFGTADGIDLEPPVVLKSRTESDPDGHVLVFVHEGPLDYRGERFVEGYVEPERAYKAYVLGDLLRVVEQTSGADVEVAPPRQLAALVERVREVFDLRLFEVDVLRDGGWLVVDVNPAVSLHGVPDAVERYETFLRETYERAIEGTAAPS